MKILLSLFCGLIFAASASAQLTTYPVGKIDRSFGDRGTFIPEVGAASYGAGGSVQLPDGKIVFANTYHNNVMAAEVIGVTKLLPTGLPDISFGNGGAAFYSFGTYTSAVSILNLTDGKLIVVGSTITNQFPSSRDLLVFRLDADGTLDTSFGENGSLILDLHGAGSADISNDIASGALALSNGKLIVSGTSARSPKGKVSGTRSMFLLRLNSDGSLDGSFGQNGILETPIGEYLGAQYDYATLARYDAGRFLLSYNVDSQADEGVQQQGYISRYFQDGSLDKTFGSAGRFTCTYGYQYFQSVCTGRAVSDGSVMAMMPFALVRVTSAGQLDTTFGNAGVRMFGTFISDYLIQDDRKILVTATDNELPPPPQPGVHQFGLLMRIFPDGAADIRFGILGRTRIDYNWSLAPGGDVFVGRVHRSDEKHILTAGLYTVNNLGSIMLTKVTISK